MTKRAKKWRWRRRMTGKCVRPWTSTSAPLPSHIVPPSTFSSKSRATACLLRRQRGLWMMRLASHGALPRTWTFRLRLRLLWAGLCHFPAPRFPLSVARSRGCTRARLPPVSPALLSCRRPHCHRRPWRPWRPRRGLPSVLPLLLAWRRRPWATAASGGTPSQARSPRRRCWRWSGGSAPRRAWRSSWMRPRLWWLLERNCWRCWCVMA
mmetsp:Transcript_46708/g.120089  ORF Transcript_46708/g.120089 Transcript_46708/m.120089 type:complete len:209 (+) Transcript_46708:154-780(+)